PPRTLSAGVVATERPPRVGSLRAAHALRERERGLVDELADDTPEHQARGVAHPRRVLAQSRKEALRSSCGERRGALVARQLHQLRLAQGREHVKADRAAATVE